MGIWQHFALLVMADIRVYVGIQWLQSGWGKVTNPAWMESGLALRTFWERAVSIPDTGKPLIVCDWYREFLILLLSSGQHTWFGKVASLGELSVGLVLGAFVGIAAFFGDS